MMILFDSSGTGSLLLAGGKTGAVQYHLIVSQSGGVISGRGTLHGDASLLSDAFMAASVTLLTEQGPEALVSITHLDRHGAQFLTNGTITGI